MAERDRELEARLLANLGGLESYPEQVVIRLDNYELEGDVAGHDKTVDEILVEAQEEAVDVSGWLLGIPAKIHPALHGLFRGPMKTAARLHQELEDARMKLALSDDATLDVSADLPVAGDGDRPLG